MAATQTVQGPMATPRPLTKEPRAARKARLRLVPSAEALLHPRAAEALTLAFRPLSPGR